MKLINSLLPQTEVKTEADTEKPADDDEEEKKEEPKQENYMDAFDKPNLNHERGVQFANEVESDDKHPEKRRKAAFAKFKEEMLPQLKEDHPGLKHS